MKAWLHQCSGEIPKGMGSPCEMAKYELDNTFPETEWTICVVPEMKDGYRIDQDDGRWVLSGGETGVLYGAYAMIRKYYSGQQVPVEMESLPRYGLRMINCWDNAIKPMLLTIAFKETDYFLVRSFYKFQFFIQ